MKSLVNSSFLRLSRNNLLYANKNLFFKNNFKLFGSNHGKVDHHDSHSNHHISDSHSHENDNHGEGHHDHHGDHDHHHHEITGEVDFNKIHVKNPKEVLIILFYNPVFLILCLDGFSHTIINIFFYF
jgi:hypothetical protein